MQNGLAVSVLDLVGMRAGETAGSAIARSVDLARNVERWGYTRYWLAEHHSISDWLVGGRRSDWARGRGDYFDSSGQRRRNAAEPRAACGREQFGTLDALYPGRIDLGLACAPGSDSQTMRALRRSLGQTGEEFPELLQELQTYLGPEKPGQIVKAIPGQGSNCA